MIKKLTAALLGATVVLAGCNTMSGMGADIKKGGEKLEKKADDVKKWFQRNHRPRSRLDGWRSRHHGYRPGHHEQ